ncbi:hypothetical protein cyc_04298 [Cyclospora cayetanensis]|uniref:Uncharacterized protein n=1 Tax=Cyclospora cayetanensis TaxID=88456 RepID=A0A1D3CT78_9EIME|nr:hypothetical protein cyc_04298 [Cyclospora cayetanensis]
MVMGRKRGAGRRFGGLMRPSLHAAGVAARWGASKGRVAVRYLAGMTHCAQVDAAYVCTYERSSIWGPLPPQLSAEQQTVQLRLRSMPAVGNFRSSAWPAPQTAVFFRVQVFEESKHKSRENKSDHAGRFLESAQQRSRRCCARGGAGMTGLDATPEGILWEFQ